MPKMWPATELGYQRQNAQTASGLKPCPCSLRKGRVPREPHLCAPHATFGKLRDAANDEQGVVARAPVRRLE